MTLKFKNGSDILWLAGYLREKNTNELQLFTTSMNLKSDEKSSVVYHLDNTKLPKTEYKDNPLSFADATKKMNQPDDFEVAEIIFANEDLIIVSDFREITTYVEYDYGSGSKARYEYDYENILVHKISDSELKYTTIIDTKYANILDFSKYLVSAFNGKVKFLSRMKREYLRKLSIIKKKWIFRRSRIISKHASILI